LLLIEFLLKLQSAGKICKVFDREDEIH